MKIDNAVYRIRPERGKHWIDRIAGPFAKALGPCCYPLRFSLVGVTPEEVTVEATVVRFSDADAYAGALSTIEFLSPRKPTASALPFTAVQIVPTGVRCEFGGYAGDAPP